MGTHEPWRDKTMSLMRERQLEACQDRLVSYPERGIFSDEAGGAGFYALWQRSYDALESPAWLTREEARAKVLARLPREAGFLSACEHDLVCRMLIGDGETELLAPEEVTASESLIARLWCAVSQNEDSVLLRLEAPLLKPLSKAMATDEHAALRALIFRFDGMLHSLLYLTGFLHADIPAQKLCALVPDKSEHDALLAARHLRASFDYIDLGGVVLTHPGLAEPERMIDKLCSQEMSGVLGVTPDMMQGGMLGILPEERPACEALAGALTDAVRPEFAPDEVVDDLRILAKQGAPIAEMEEVLAASLCQMPTPSMRALLSQVHLTSVRWAGMPAAVLH